MVMLKQENGVRWALAHRTDIMDMEDPTSVYLTRWRLFECPWFGVYLHAIRINDSDRHIHSHPWGFWSFVLRGGYVEAGPHRLDVTSLWTDCEDPSVQEERLAARRALDRPTEHEGSPIWGRTRSWRPGSLHRVRPGEFHSVLRLFHFPTWTIIFVGRRDARGWGFATPDGLVPDGEYRAYMTRRARVKGEVAA